MSPADLMMPGATPLLAAAAAAVFLLAGVVKGVVGLGLPTISMASAGADHGARASRRAAGGAIAGHQPVAGSARRDLRPDLAPHRRHAGGRLRRHAGGRLAGAPSGVWAGVCMGVALVLYAAWGLFGSPPSIPHAARRRAGPGGGRRDGLVTAATGVFCDPGRALSAGAEPGQGRADPGHGNLLRCPRWRWRGPVAERQLRRGCGGRFAADAAARATGHGTGTMAARPAVAARPRCASWRAWRCWASTRFSRAWLARAIPRRARPLLPSGRGACVLTPRVAFPAPHAARRRSSSGPMAIDISRQRANSCCTDWILMRA